MSTLSIHTNPAMLSTLTVVEVAEPDPVDVLAELEAEKAARGCTVCAHASPSAQAFLVAARRAGHSTMSIKRKLSQRYGYDISRETIDKHANHAAG